MVSTITVGISLPTKIVDIILSMLYAVLSYFIVMKWNIVHFLRRIQEYYPKISNVTFSHLASLSRNFCITER